MMEIDPIADATEGDRLATAATDSTPARKKQRRDSSSSAAPAPASLPSGLSSLPMRCNVSVAPSVLLPRLLFLGCESSASNRNSLIKLKVRLVLNMAREVQKPNFHKQLEKKAAEAAASAAKGQSSQGQAARSAVRPDQVMEYEHHELEDVDHEPAMTVELLHYLADRIQASVAQEKAVLIHCVAGISRSVTVAIAYFLKYGHLHPGTLEERDSPAHDSSASAAAAGSQPPTPSFQACYNYVQSKRLLACPNAGFVRTLKMFQQQLASGDYVQASLPIAAPSAIASKPAAPAAAAPSPSPSPKPLPNMPYQSAALVTVDSEPTTPAAIFAQLCEQQATRWLADATPIVVSPTVPTNALTIITPPSASPLVSVIMPVHNAAAFLLATLTSLLHQSHRPLELCLYDDHSQDGSLDVVERFTPAFEEAGIKVRIASSQLSGQTQAHGAGYARNRAMELAQGTFYAFQDSDDLSLPTRIEQQLQEWRETAAAQEHDDFVAPPITLALPSPDGSCPSPSPSPPPSSSPSSTAVPLILVGCHLERLPSDATPRWTRWINSMSKAQLLHHAFREITVPCPTWFTHAGTFKQVGAFQEVLGEDMHFFYSSLLAASAKLTKVLGDPLLVYRNHASNLSGRTPFAYLFQLRAKALETLVLDSGRYSAFAGDKPFTIWNAGKAGKHLYRALSTRNQARVAAFCDIDPAKIERGVFEAHVQSSRTPPKRVPIISWADAVAPVIIAVRQELEENDSQREFRHRIEVVKGWKEGVDYFFLS